MKHIALAGLTIVAASCGGDRDSRYGELGHVRRRSEHLAVSGNLVHRAYGAHVYTFDVSDPRDPYDIGEQSYAFTNCTQGLALSGGYGYCVALRDLAKVGLPSSPVPVWTTELPDFGEDYRAYGVRTLPDGRLVIARSGDDALNGDLLVVDVSSGSAEFGSLEDPDGDHYLIDSDGAVVAASVSATPVRMVALYDFAVATSSLEFSRQILPVGPDDLLQQVALDGNDIVVSVDPLSPVDYLLWYRYDPSDGSWTQMGRADGLPILISGSYPGGLELAEGYAFLALTTGTGVFRLDPDQGLVHVRTLKDRGYVGEIKADLDRRLLYVGGNSFQVFDLGAVTTGESDW